MKRNFLLTGFLMLMTLAGFAGKKNNAAFAALTTPTTVTAINTFAGGIKIDWVHTGTAPTSYQIEVTDNAVVNVVPIMVIYPTKTKTILSTDVTFPLTPGHTYSFRVKAIADISGSDTDSPFSAASANLVYIGGLLGSQDLIKHTNAMTFDRILLQWTDRNDENEDGYELTGVGSTPIDVPKTATNNANYNYLLTGLTPKTFYNVNVRAYKVVGGVRVYSEYANGASFTTKKAPVATPQIFFTANCPTFVGINWTVDRPEDVESFIILRSFNGANFDVVGIKTSGETIYYDQDAREGRRIWYRVVAVNESTPNGQPSPDKFIDVTPYSAPPAPVNVFSDKALRSNSFLTIKWSNPSFDAGCGANVRASNYLMYKLATETEFRVYGIYNAETNSARIEGLKPKDIVDFRVFSLSNQGKSSAWIGGRDTTLGPPYAPSGLRAASSVDALGNTITTLLWEDNARDEDGFTVEVSTDNVTFTELGKRRFNMDFVLVNFIHTPVQEGVKYYYRVKAYSNSQGSSDYTTVLSHTADYTTAPKAPYNFKAKLVSGKVVLTWLDDSSREENFVVEKSSDNGTTYASIATLGRNVLTFTDENVTATASYKYRVKAVNIKGSSAYATVDYKSATTPAARVISPEAISLYPNPTADFVNIKIPSELIGKSGNIVITDKNSRIILDKTYKFDGEELNLDLNKYGEGMYNVTISTGDTKVSKKVYKF